MPIVPFTAGRPSTPLADLRPPPDETFALMAAAQMHSEGRLIPPQSQMPFPDNRNPDTDFDSRFPRNLRSGILNDLKAPTDPVPPLTRKI